MFLWQLIVTASFWISNHHGNTVWCVSMRVCPARLNWRWRPIPTKGSSFPRLCSRTAQKWESQMKTRFHFSLLTMENIWSVILPPAAWMDFMRQKKKKKLPCSLKLLCQGKRKVTNSFAAKPQSQYYSSLAIARLPIWERISKVHCNGFNEDLRLNPSEQGQG